MTKDLFFPDKVVANFSHESGWQLPDADSLGQSTAEQCRTKLSFCSGVSKELMGKDAHFETSPFQL